MSFLARQLESSSYKEYSFLSLLQPSLSNDIYKQCDKTSQ